MKTISEKSEAQERLEHLISLARQCLRASAAGISILEAGGIRVFSEQGMDFRGILPRGSLCERAIQANGVFVVEDASLDPRFSSFVFVAGPPHLRFYAGCPLADSSGRHAGVFFISDPKPRAFSEEERKILAGLSRLAEWNLNTSDIRQSILSLQRSESRFQDLVESINDILWEVDHQGRYTYVSPNAASIMGYEPQEMIGKTPFDFMPEEEAKRVGKLFGEIASRKRPFSLLRHFFLKKSGETGTMECGGRPIFDRRGSFQGYRGVDRDVTESVRTEEALKKSEEHFRLLVEHAADGFFLHDLEGRFVDANERACRSLGYSRQELLSMRVWDLAMPRTFDRRQLQEHWRSMKERTPMTLEGFHRRKDGSSFPVEIRLEKFRSEGRPLLLALARDITERRRTDESLRLIVEGTAAVTGQDFFRSLVRHTALALGTKYALVTRRLDSPPRHVRAIALWAGGAYGESVDIPLEGMPCKTVLEGKFCFHQEKLLDLFPKLRDFVPDAQSYMGIPLLNSRGEAIGHLAVLNDKPMMDERERSSKVLRIFAARAGAELERSMAEEALRQAEFQLRQSQKMEAVGQMAGGIAHDFNNFLTAIWGSAELLRSNPELPAGAREDVNIILTLCASTARLTRQIMDFSRKGFKDYHPVEFKKVLAQSSEFFKRTLPENILMRSEVSDEDLPISGDEAQLHQVLINLILNSRDAMPRGGELTLKLEPMELAPGDPLPCPDMQPGSWVRLSVKDGGTGISPENLNRIFEPFFTTKEVGKGTGLGLSQVYGIVKQMNGFIRVSSEPGKGTAFDLFFRLIPSERKREKTLGDEAALQGKGETILLVEDEAMVLKVARRMLEETGYRVISVSSGEEALKTIASAGRKVDLILTDLTMPGISGLALSKAVGREHPDLPVVIMSGYPLKTEMDEMGSAKVSAWMPKPLNLNQLAKTLRGSLLSQKG